MNCEKRNITKSNDRGQKSQQIRQIDEEIDDKIKDWVRERKYRRRLKLRAVNQNELLCTN